MATQATAHPDRRLISSEDVQGTDVSGIEDEAIGEIDHLLIEKVTGRIAYAVMSFGGFLGLAHGIVHPLVGAKIRFLFAGISDWHYRSAVRDAPRVQ